MSYGFSFEVVKGVENFDDEELFGSLDPDIRDVAEEAATSAIDLVLLGALGDPDDFDFFVNISGHKNPHNIPRPGWANDCLTINIVQKMKEHNG